MDDRLRFINHHDTVVLLVDFSNLAKAELLSLLGNIQATISKQPKGSVLTLADFTGARVDKEVAMEMKKVLTLDRPYVKRSAWVGTASLPKVFYENFKSFSQRDFPTFATRDEALAWLIKE